MCNGKTIYKTNAAQNCGAFCSKKLSITFSLSEIDEYSGKADT